MADYRGTLRAARPVLAGAVVAAGERGAVRLRSGQHVMAVRRVAAAVDDLALFAERSLLGEVVGAMQLAEILGDHHALGVLPRTLADAVARVLRGLAVGGLRRQIRAPGFRARARRLRQRLAIIVGARKAAEIAAIADAGAGDEKRGAGALCMRGLGGDRDHRNRG